MSVICISMSHFQEKTGHSGTSVPLKLSVILGGEFGFPDSQQGGDETSKPPLKQREREEVAVIRLEALVQG